MKRNITCSTLVNTLALNNTQINFFSFVISFSNEMLFFFLSDADENIFLCLKFKYF